MLDIYHYGRPPLPLPLTAPLHLPLIPVNNVNQTPMTVADIIAAVNVPLTILEESLAYQVGMKESLFTGMDRSGRGVCIKYFQGLCPFGEKCPLRHLIGHKIVVCKHWLRGLCKKGDICEFLHEYDLTKMPECFFFSKYMACSNRECPFRHIDPETKIKDCLWYDRGFCKHGPYCKLRHRKRVMCPSYLLGFCPDGRDCKYTHPLYNVNGPENPITNNKKICGLTLICHNCHERGHKAINCPNLPTNKQCTDGNLVQSSGSVSIIGEKKTMSDITCYKCGEKGHYANRCHKGMLAFLSNTVHLAEEQRKRDEKNGRMKCATRFARFGGV